MIGKVDEILGPINEYMFSVQCEESVKAKSLKPGTDVYMAGNCLMDIERFTNPSGPGSRGQGGGRRRGNRGGSRGQSRGAPRGNRPSFRRGRR